MNVACRLERINVNLALGVDMIGATNGERKAANLDCSTLITNAVRILRTHQCADASTYLS